jgi:hypothetical protein
MDNGVGGPLRMENNPVTLTMPDASQTNVQDRSQAAQLFDSVGIRVADTPQPTVTTPPEFVSQQPPVVEYAAPTVTPVAVETPKTTPEDNLSADYKFEDIQIVDAEINDKFTGLYKEFEDKVTELRIKSVSAAGLNPDEQRQLNECNSYISYANMYREEVRQKFEEEQARQAEMSQLLEAQDIITQAEMTISSDEGSVDGLRSQLTAMALKLKISLEALLSKIHISTVLADKLLGKQTPAIVSPVDSNVSTTPTPEPAPLTI